MFLENSEKYLEFCQIQVTFLEQLSDNCREILVEVQKSDCGYRRSRLKNLNFRLKIKNHF